MKLRCLACVWLLLNALPAPAQLPKVTEYQIEAAYLYNFGKFVSVPSEIAAGKGSDFQICVIGKDPFNNVLDDVVSGETLEGKPVVARRIREPEEAAPCRIVYISSSEEQRLDSVLRKIAPGTLTVSDIHDFSRRGGMIEFVAEANKVRFSVDLQPIRDARITVSSDLLRVALTVRGNLSGGSR